MSHSPLDQKLTPESRYLEYFRELAERIRAGASFSGRERNCAFLNLGGKSFADASAALGLDLEQDSRGLAVCDWDGDGDVDFWLSNRTAPKLQLLQNQGGGRSVSVLLQGKPEMGSPRDAAGARVVVICGEEELSRTVHLGDGFVSQSSRWLSFGLGEREMSGCRVFWPGGFVEEFVGLRERGRFILVQGTGQAKEEKRKGKSLEESEAVLPDAEDSSRVWLSRPRELAADLGIPRRAAFVNLWSRWCAPCLAELEEFGQADDLPIVLINVDGDEGGSEEELNRILKNQGFDGGTKRASNELVSAFNEVILDSVYRHLTLPVPSTFLLDDAGLVRAIYKGPVSSDTLRADLARISWDEGEQKMASVPFPGRWSADLFDTDPITVASAYQEGGYFEDAKAYLEKYLEEDLGEGEVRMRRLADLHLKIGLLERGEGRHEAALSRFQKVVEYRPGDPGGRILLTLTLAELGRGDEARREVADLRMARPDDVNFMNLEAQVHEILGDDARAAAGYRKVLQSNRRYVPAIHALASLLATSRSDAIRDGSEALALARFLMGAPGASQEFDFILAMADALAETGDRVGALAELDKARDLIAGYGKPAERRAVAARKAAYAAGKAFRRKK